MNRNLKALLAAALALGAIGAIGASAVSAAQFHCSVEPCRYTLNPDGTGKTAHHVFVLETKDTSESLSFTCPSLSGEGTSSAKTSSELTVTNISYGLECKVGGAFSLIARVNSCDYRFTAAGQVSIECPEGNVIEIELQETGCIYTIGPQGPLSGVTYHTIGTAPNREVTVSTNVHGIATKVDGTKAQCLIATDQTLETTYTTGNTIVTAETDTGSPEMADGWWE